MGRPKKDPAAVRSVPLNFRVSPAVKGAIDVLSARHATETGDDSLTGWFIAMVTREARAAGVPIGVAPEAPPVKEAPKGKATRSGKG